MTTTTPFAASIDGEVLYIGDTRESAIAGAVEDWKEKIDVGDIDEPEWPHLLKLVFYTDVEWCKGAPDDEDCFCGMNHNDYEGPWLAIGWADDAEIEEEVAS